MKLAYVEIDAFNAMFEQHTDSSYKVTAQVKNILFDDLREAHKTDAIVHLINRHFTLDPNRNMLMASLEYKSKHQTHSIARQLSKYE